MLYFKLCVGDSHMCKSNLFTPLINYERAKASKADTGAHIHAHRRHSATHNWCECAMHVRLWIWMWCMYAPVCALVCMACGMSLQITLHVLHASGTEQRNNRIKMKRRRQKRKIVKQRNETMHASQLLRARRSAIAHSHSHTHTFWGQRDLRSISFYCVVRAQVNEMYSTAVDRKAAPPHTTQVVFLDFYFLKSMAWIVTLCNESFYLNRNRFDSFFIFSFAVAVR